MQSLKLTGRFEADPADTEEDPEDDAYDVETYRVICPACTRPIALPADEDVLPEHALCPTPWNPFVLTVCPGTGTTASLARPADESPEDREQEAGLLLTLPQGLDWRMQPFSHAGGPGSRPLRLPVQRRRQAA
ncbi:hypothetical protein [Streptomyces nitrosporeus]|uniref:Uncharacterized protein n=1 Tax=Streptomyces nitrosporeus TaxID=28894 RepID=A0A5J6FHP5_9ACTN|nr:hypothetical protein [Streptomyces nitrosporeus]QEU75561.1 hypothetical protein CP967_29465 [Streptomyces nitrosporeus]GGZ29681.1 hypothetical protein GCM10010327_69950 [Streptomyces nitrosporeus]